mgnify:CR=1 FL=1|jgi:hypothetical protein
MNQYIFEKASDTLIRVIWIETDPEHGYRSVANIGEMSFNGTKENLKFVVKSLYEMMFIGNQFGDSEGYKLEVPNKDYDVSLEGKARKQSSKEINVLTELLFC